MVSGDQKGGIRIGPERTIMKLSRASRLSQDHTSCHWLAQKSHWPERLPRTREEKLFLTQVNYDLQVLCSLGFSLL